MLLNAVSLLCVSDLRSVFSPCTRVATSVTLFSHCGLLCPSLSLSVSSSSRLLFCLAARSLRLARGLLTATAAGSCCNVPSLRSIHSLSNNKWRNHPNDVVLSGVSFSLFCSNRRGGSPCRSRFPGDSKTHCLLFAFGSSDFVVLCNFAQRCATFGASAVQQQAGVYLHRPAAAAAKGAPKAELYGSEC